MRWTPDRWALPSRIGLETTRQLAVVGALCALWGFGWIGLFLSASAPGTAWQWTWVGIRVFAFVATVAAGVLFARAAATRARNLAVIEERGRLLIDGTSDYAIFMLDPDGSIATWNAGAQRIKGYTEAEAVGMNFAMFYTEEARADGQPPRELELARTNGRNEVEGWRVRKDGSLFWADVVITRVTDQYGVERGFSKVTRDLSERRISDLALRESEEKFRRAFDDAPTAESLTDLQGQYVQVNAAMSHLVGYSIDALLSMRGLDITHPDDYEADREAFEDLVSGGIEFYAREKRYVHVDGSVVWTRVHAVPVHDSDGNVASILNHALDITQRRHYELHLVELATHDALTGLVNRTKFREELSSHLERCRRYGPSGAVLMLDLDHFKRVNDTLGHNTGDELIVSMAVLLRSRMRSADVVARLGGDEFAILLPEGGADSAEIVAAALVEAVRGDVTALDGGRPRIVTVSIGIAVVEDTNVTSHEILAAADLAMYDAKEAGRDRYSFYADKMHVVSKSKAQITWAERIEHALENDGFELWAQPILNLRTNRIESHELLLRMRAPDGDMVLPGHFLYVAERVGLIGEIDRWVTTRAIELLARIQQTQPRHRLEVNLSGLSVGDEDLRVSIAETAAESTADPAGLIFEITETAAVQHIIAARDFAHALRDIGCRFALDDFGAGFGSFYYLKHLPFDYVKIDGEFIAACTTNLTDRLVIDSVVSIAQGLGKKTVAEFVIDEKTLDLLRRHGVDYAQGYHIGRPAPIDEAFPDLPVGRIGESFIPAA
jgi:diguanylate cyclase (GGDEF)-like protein/PAS domain S-box-containing protein